MGTETEGAVPEGEQPTTTTYAVVMAALWALAIGVNVWIIANDCTDDALNRAAGAAWTRSTARLRDWWTREQLFKRLAPHVVFDAMEAAREAAGE